MFGQSYLIGKGCEVVVTALTGNPTAGKVAHIAASKISAIATIDPAGHAASWADVGSSLVHFGGNGPCTEIVEKAIDGCTQFLDANNDAICDTCTHGFGSHLDTD